jgi:hypothetical protein
MNDWNDPRTAEAQIADTVAYGVHETCGTPLTVMHRMDGDGEIRTLACPRCGDGLERGERA